MSPLLGGIAPRGQINVAGAGGNEPISDWKASRMANIGVDDDEGYEHGPNTKVIDLNGRRVVPGLNDSHLLVIRTVLGGSKHRKQTLRR